MSLYRGMMLGFRNGIFLTCIGSWLLVPWTRAWCVPMFSLTVVVGVLVWLMEDDVS